jgi:demethylmenaquinone methyltransferase / 2-methoxy-6-polyprenyl-1,4-benzoquinol methylase
VIVRGSSPAGAENEEQAARWVRGMFDRIAPRYDLVNHVLSMNIDRYWRARTASQVAHILRRPDARVLDLCCGTGDLMLAFERKGPAQMFASDFSHPMLVAASAKTKRSRIFEADALCLPLNDGGFDLISVAFGFRNLANYQRGLEELLRVLKPGGTLAILEFSQPPNRLWSLMYEFYSKAILPTVGGLISGSREAYAYLPDSVRKFPGPELLATQMSEIGYAEVRFERLTGGIAALHIGRRKV